MTESPSSPLFLVGPSRGGTAMMRSMLNNHPAIHIAGETHYFDDLRVKLAAKAQAPLDPAGARRCEAYFRALSHRPYGHAGDPEQGWLDAEALRAEAARIGDGADAWFEAFCRLHGPPGKRYWGEKTPRHVFRIPEILARYPQARVICMVRDPRAIVASYRDWTNQGGFDLEKDAGHRAALAAEEARTRTSYHVLIQAMLWRGVANASLGAGDRFGPAKVRLQRYEDFVEDPRAAGAAIIDWLGLDWRDELLEVPMHNSSFSSFDASGGVSTEAVGRWRSKLSPAEIAAVQDCCGGLMDRLGYARAPTGLAPGRVVPWATLPFAVFAAARANRARMGSLPGYILRRLRLATGT